MANIKIFIQLHTIAQMKTSKGVENKINLEISAGTSAIDIINQLNLELGWDDLLVIINQKIISPSYILQDGDILQIIPAISGG